MAKHVKLVTITNDTKLVSLPVIKDVFCRRSPSHTRIKIRVNFLAKSSPLSRSLSLSLLLLVNYSISFASLSGSYDFYIKKVCVVHLANLFYNLDPYIHFPIRPHDLEFN
jgi:hypothetical protein